MSLRQHVSSITGTATASSANRAVKQPQRNGCHPPPHHPHHGTLTTSVSSSSRQRVRSGHLTNNNNNARHKHKYKQEWIVSCNVLGLLMILFVTTTFPFWSFSSSLSDYDLLLHARGATTQDDGSDESFEHVDMSNQYNNVRSIRTTATALLPQQQQPSPPFVFALQNTTTMGLRNCSSPEYYLTYNGDVNGTTTTIRHSFQQRKRESAWPLGNCPKPEGTSRVTGDTCGLCSQSRFARHLQELANHIQAAVTTTSTKQQRQQQLCPSAVVVFGAAFGKTYFDWVWKKRWQQVYGNFSACHFMLVLDETLESLPTSRRRRRRHQTTTTTLGRYNQTRMLSSMVGVLPGSTVRTGGQYVVGVRRADLPYQNHRRNIKLFKLNPHLLFPWAERVVWVDAKLKLSQHYRSHGLKRYMDQTLHKNNGVCGTVVSLPLHNSTMGMDFAASLSTVRFSCQCNAILKAFEFRPQVSDSSHSVQSQCDYYLQQTTLQTTTLAATTTTRTLAKDDSIPGATAAAGPPLQVSLPQRVSPVLDTAMIDSAILVWDFRTAECRNFVADLLCTWLSEIHCFSDRDQLSFPFALYQMQAQLATTTTTSSFSQPAFPETQHRIFTVPIPRANKNMSAGAANAGNQQQQIQRMLPALNFVKSACHWYYGKAALFKCRHHDYNGERGHGEDDEEEDPDDGGNEEEGEEANLPNADSQGKALPPQYQGMPLLIPMKEIK